MRPNKLRACSACSRPWDSLSVHILVAMMASSRRLPSAWASTSSAWPYIGDESNRLMPAASASSTMAVRSAAVSKVCQVPIPITGTCKAVPPSLRRSSGLLQIVNRYRLYRVGEFEAEHARVEIKFGLERAVDVLRDPGPVLFPLTRDVGDR